MIYKYVELTEKGIYKTDVEIKSALEQELIYKIEYGLYSDKKINSKLEIISKKYEKYIFNSESAFFYHGLTDNIPLKYFFASKRGSQKIKDENIIQSYVDDKYFDIGDSFMNYNNIKIRIYDKERMLIELIRNKNNMPYDMYKEILKIMNEKIFCFGINGIFKLENLINLIDKILSNENHLKKTSRKKEQLD